MYDSYFQTCVTLLVCRRQGTSVSYGHVYLLFVFTNVNLIIRPWLFGEVADCSIEADDCRTSFFNVATRPYSLLSNYLIFRATEIVE